MGQKISFLDPHHHGSYQVVLLGLDNAGKSTILYRLKMGHFIQTAPTVGFNCERVKGTEGKAKNTSFVIWDVGGEDKLRPLWRTYIRHTDAVVLVVDSTEKERFEEAKLELSNLLRYPDVPSNAPVLLIANKQDLPGAATVSETQDAIGLQDLSPAHPSDSLACCAVTGEGLEGVYDVICELVQKGRKLEKSRRKNR